MNSFVEYSICNRPGTSAYSAPKSGYHHHHHHHHPPHHLHHLPLDQQHQQGFPVTSGSFHTGPTGSAAPGNGTRSDSSYTYGGSGATQHHHEQEQHQHNGYHHHPHLQTQSVQSGTLSPYNNSANTGAYSGQACATNSDYGPPNPVHTQYFMEDSVASTYYHQSTFPSSASSTTVGPSYGALAGAYCGPQGALAGPQYPQQLGGGLDAAGYLGLPHGGGYGELPVSQDRERGDEEEQQAGQGQTFDWMKVKRNPPKTGEEKEADFSLFVT